MMGYSKSYSEIRQHWVRNTLEKSPRFVESTQMMQINLWLQTPFCMSLSKEPRGTGEKSGASDELQPNVQLVSRFHPHITMRKLTKI